MYRSGKTTLGKFLAQKIGSSFLDLDAWVEMKTGQAIKDLYQNLGEQAFRALEAKHLQALSSFKGILALGGGSFSLEENRLFLRKLGSICYLKISFEALETRLAQTRYPVFAKTVFERKILFETRTPVFEKEADKVFDTEHQTLEEICQAIILDNVFAS